MALGPLSEQWLAVAIEASTASFTLIYFAGIRTRLKVEHDAGMHGGSEVPSSLRKAGESTCTKQTTFSYSLYHDVWQG